MIGKLYSVSIHSKEPKKLAAFYRDTLGFPVKQEGGEGVILDLGGAWLVIQKSPTAAASARPAAEVSATPRYGLAIEVEDVDAVYKKLKSELNFEMAPEDEDWGARTVSGFDPEGNRIDFISVKAKAKGAPKR